MRGAIAAALLFLAPAARAQEFGQNHVVLKDFQWKIRSTEHFDIHYYEGEEALVPEAAAVLEEGFSRFTKALEIPLDAPPWAPPAAHKRFAWKRRPFFLYASPNDFQQSNIAKPGDGTGGITEPFKNRFMVYNDGSRQWLEEVTLHEFVHILQFHVLISGFWRSGAILKTIVYPLWMMEGMAGFMTYSVESALEEITIRDAATSGGLIPLTRLEHFGHLKPHQTTLAYKQGAAALEFLSEQYGRRKVGQMLKLFESKFETSGVLQELTGLDAFQFDRKYREYLEGKYDRVRRKERLREPEAYGGVLTRGDGIPQFNTAPVFTPDGASMVYMTSAEGFPPTVYEMDLKSGRSKKLARIGQPRLEGLPLGNFANLSRVLSLSGDGRLLAFMGSKNHRDGLYLYDRRTRRLDRRELPGFQAATQPSLSPDGKRVVFSGMKDAATDLYLYDLESGSITALTQGPEDDAMPVFTPDGRSVVYSSETADPLDPRKHQRRLLKVELAGRSVTALEDLGGEARDPMVSADGRKVLFVLEDGRFSEVCELDLATGRAVRLTRSVGGSFTPAYAPDGEVAFSALRRGSVHIYKGTRSLFEDEELPPASRRVSRAEKFLLPGMGSVGVSSAPVALSPQRPYKFTASTDLFLPAAFYSSAGGFFWTSYWQGSDMLGNHQANGLVSFASGRAYDYQARYGYGRYRPQLAVGVQGVGQKGLLENDTNLVFDDALHAQFFGISYPFDRFHRVETALISVSEKLRYTDIGRRDDRQARLATAALVRDTVRGRYLVANAGGRARLAYTKAAEVLGGSRRYEALSLELHKFLPTGGQSALALRAAGLQSIGRDAPELILGGLGGVRGYGRSTTRDSGSRLGVLNAEWRFPVLPDLNYYMWYFFPDFYFKSVYGSVFSDLGYAWESQGQAGATRLKDLRNSVGLGLKIYTFILQEFPLVVAFDYAHRTTQNGGIFYVYLGTLF